MLSVLSEELLSPAGMTLTGRTAWMSGKDHTLRGSGSDSGVTALFAFAPAGSVLGSLLRDLGERLPPEDIQQHFLAMDTNVSTLQCMHVCASPPVHACVCIPSSACMCVCIPSIGAVRADCHMLSSLAVLCCFATC